MNKIKNMEMQLRDKIKHSYSLGRKKYHYNNDVCLLLDGINTRHVKMKDVKVGDVIKSTPKTPAVKITSKPVLEAYKFGGYRWDCCCETVTRIKDEDEE